MCIAHYFIRPSTYIRVITVQFLNALRALTAVTSPALLQHPMRMLQHTATRCSVRYLSTSSLSSRVPWFIDSSEASRTQQTSFQKGSLPPLPPGVPVTLQTLHAQLALSPYLEPSELLVRDPIPQPPGPPLPMSAPKGRRKRGGTDFGKDFLLQPGNLWNWIVLAQVRLALVMLSRVMSLCLM